MKLRKFFLILQFLLFVILFRDLWILLFSTWKQDPDFSYGIFIIIITFFMIWLKKRKQKLSFHSPSLKFMLVGWIILFIAFSIYYFARIIPQVLIMNVCMVITAIILLMLNMGWDFIKDIKFPLFYLIFIAPPPYTLYRLSTIKLKVLASIIATGLLKLMGLKVMREGVLININNKVLLEVIDACSGMRFLLCLFFVSLALSYIVKVRLYKRILIVAITIPVAILANSLRIAFGGISNYFLGKVMETKFMHSLEGLFVYVIGFLIYFWLFKFIVKNAKKRDSV